MSLMHFAVGVGVGLLTFLLYGHFTYEENNHRHQNSEQPRASPRQSQSRQRLSSVNLIANQKSGDNCSICLETMNAHDIRQLLCGHALHKKCYDDCIKSSHKTCPLCKQRMI